MRSTVQAVLGLASVAAAATTSSKRGLVYVPSADHPTDDNIWSNSTGDLSWYYNYKALPSAAYDGSKLEFVPMLWGLPNDPANDMTFYNTVKNLISAGTKVTYVLGFNEPDGCVSGGSCLDAGDAATVWKKQFEPLKADFGIKLGAPAVTGAPGGFTWLDTFFEACRSMSDTNSTCDVDFIPVHWYGNFEGLASHIGQVNATYLNISTSLWLTEYACAECTLDDAQYFYNQSSEYLDNMDYMTHYSYFGAFRSDVSNVGPNAAFLTEKGKLTDIGSWYMGQKATGNIPSSKSDSSSSAASTTVTFAGWSFAVAASIFWSMC